MAPKIFVFGHVNGQLESAFSKLTTLHAKNDFALALVTGNLFSADEDDDSTRALLDGRISVPCPTYFTVGSKALPKSVVKRIEADEEIAPNLHYLGKRSVTKTTDGVRIVTLGGIGDPEILAGQSKEQHLPFHTIDDVKALRGANSADILLTTVWPAGIWKGSNVSLPVEPSTIPASDAISDLCATLKPRYHFSPSLGEFSYEREPFFHTPTGGDMEQTTHVTRFISLASYGNPAKAKTLYAFNLPKEIVGGIPPGSTGSPFFQPAKSRKRPAEDSGSYSRFSNGKEHHRRKHRRQRSPPPGPDQCFFCLANANLSTHMLCSIGDDSYLATAKGPLPSKTTFTAQGLSFPGHLIIVPLTHAPKITTDAMGEPDAAKTFKEMDRYREALQAMVSAQSQRKLGAVTFEISRSRGIHVHWQFIPVPGLLVKKGLIEAAFRVEADNLKLPQFEVKDFGISDEVQGDYFRVWIWVEEEPEDYGDKTAEGGRMIRKSLLMRYDQSVRFDLQFGRRVLAKLLGLDDRLVWQDINQTEDEEKADAEAFKEVFKPWDFTLMT